MVNLISIKELIRPRLCPTEIIFFISIEIWLCEIIYMLQNSEVHVIFFPLSLQISPFFSATACRYSTIVNVHST